MNNINLVGRLSKKPELRYTQNNKAVCQFDIAVNRIGQDTTDFITCVVWEKQAENLNKYQDKGSLIGISGSLRVDKYQNDKGENRYKTYVSVSNIEYLSSKQLSETMNNENPVSTRTATDEQIYADFGDAIEINDDDLPF